jgi:hypothetical protein
MGELMGDLSKNFSRHEFACDCGCGLDSINPLIVEILQDIRDRFGKKLTIHERGGCRCKALNKLAGGAPESRHLPHGPDNLCDAADYDVEDVSAQDVFRYVDKKWGNIVGMGQINATSLHTDCRGYKARWTY